MPPTMGAAMGFITSEPMPDSHRIGARLRITAVTVISLGRRRWTAPAMVAMHKIGLGQRRALLHPLLKRLMQVDHHHNAGFDGNPEERDVAHPHSHAEVVAEQPLQQQPARHRVERWEDEHSSLGDGFEDQIEKQKNDEEDNRQNDREPLLGAHLELVFAGPAPRVTGGQRNLLTQQCIGAIDEAAVIARLQVQIDVAGKGAVFVANHCGAARVVDSRNLAYGNLRAGRRRNQRLRQGVGSITKIAQVANGNREALAAFDVFGNIHAADL